VERDLAQLGILGVPHGLLACMLSSTVAIGYLGSGGRRPSWLLPGGASKTRGYLGVIHASWYDHTMKTIQVRNVSDDVHRALRARAAAMG